MPPLSTAASIDTARAFHAEVAQAVSRGWNAERVRSRSALVNNHEWRWHAIASTSLPGALPPGL